jgi:hypothetical protein
MPDNELRELKEFFRDRSAYVVTHGHIPSVVRWL